MSSNRIAVSYKDLCSKGLISDLKLAAVCEVRTVCRLSCDRCPNVCNAIDFEQISVAGLQLDHIAIKQTGQPGNLEVHVSATNIVVWLEKNGLAHQAVPG